MELLTGSRSRHSGLSWQHAKREQHSRVRGPSTKARLRQCPCSRVGPECFPGWGGGWPGTGQVRRTFLVPRAGQAQILMTKTQGPSGTFPKPTAGVRRRWEKGLGGHRAFTHSHTHMHTHTHVDIGSHTLIHGETHINTHKCRHTGADRHTHVFKHTDTHLDIYSHTYTHTH